MDFETPKSDTVDSQEVSGDSSKKEEETKPPILSVGNLRERRRGGDELSIEEAKKIQRIKYGYIPSSLVRQRIVREAEHNIINSLGGGMLGKKVGEGWLERRGKLFAEKSGINDLMQKMEEKEIRIVDIGSGKQHINNAIVEANSDKDIRIVGFDRSDHATKKVAENESIGSVYALGGALPIYDKSVDIVKFDFTFQEATNRIQETEQNEIQQVDNNKVQEKGNKSDGELTDDENQKESVGEIIQENGNEIIKYDHDESQEKFIEEAKRVLKDNGRIVITDDVLRDDPSDRKKVRIKSNVLNRKFSNLNLKSEKDFCAFFEKNGLEVLEIRYFREDNDPKKRPQFVTYILKKKEDSEKSEAIGQ